MSFRCRFTLRLSRTDSALDQYGSVCDTMSGVTMLKHAVIDTSVLVAALRSSQGASYRLLAELERGRFRAVMTVPLCLEYEEVLGRFVSDCEISQVSCERILDYLCAHARLVDVHYLWRPCLNDPDDEMVLEAALAGGARNIVTFNRRDFVGATALGVTAITPGEMLRRLEMSK